MKVFLYNVVYYKKFKNNKIFYLRCLYFKVVCVIMMRDCDDSYFLIFRGVMNMYDNMDNNGIVCCLFCGKI